MSYLIIIHTITVFFKSGGDTPTGTNLHQPLKFATFGNPLIPTLDTPLLATYLSILLLTTLTLHAHTNYSICSIHLCSCGKTIPSYIQSTQHLHSLKLCPPFLLHALINIYISSSLSMSLRCGFHAYIQYAMRDLTNIYIYQHC